MWRLRVPPEQVQQPNMWVCCRYLLDGELYQVLYVGCTLDGMHQIQGCCLGLLFLNCHSRRCCYNTGGRRSGSCSFWCCLQHVEENAAACVAAGVTAAAPVPLIFFCLHADMPVEKGAIAALASSTCCPVVLGLWGWRLCMHAIVHNTHLHHLHVTRTLLAAHALHSATCRPSCATGWPQPPNMFRARNTMHGAV